MLTRLVIHDVVLIEKLSLELAPGLNVFTGETGTGKSIVLDALGLTLGERSDVALIRAGAPQAAVTAEFTLPPEHAAFALAEEQGLSIANPLILRRVIGSDGKSRAFVNDQPISIGLLKRFGEILLEIHGQFETHGLLNPAAHRELLDAFGGLGALKDSTAQAFTTWRDADDALRNACISREKARSEEEFLRAAVAELEELAPETGEDETLALRRSGLQHREKIIEALQIAQHELDGEGRASHALAQAGKAVARIVDKADGLKELLAAIDRAADETADAMRQLETALNTIDDDPNTLQNIEERLFALRACARKHSVTVDELPELQKDLSGRLALLTGQGDQLTMLGKAAAATKRAYENLARDLSIKRTQASMLLEKAVTKELPPLKLERATFKIDIAPLPEMQWSAEGIDKITFQASTNPGAVPGLLQKIASGGELARFMLALKVTLAAAASVSTLVFDEVDSGIGGATASAVGERLARLAKHVQILVVTHSPQVAARGNNHLRVLKEAHAKTSTTVVETLDAAARREEIARMLAGTTVTNAAREAAESLLEDALEAVPPKAAKRARVS